MLPRRTFLRKAAGAAALAGLGDFGFLSQLPPVSAAEAQLEPRRVQLDADMELLVRLLEESPRERVIEEFATRVRRGLPYRDLVAALLLAGVRGIQPRPIGFKFHAVLAIHAAHLASLSSPESDRWLPIFWAIDLFKGSQETNAREGNWRMPPVDEPAVPPSHRARQAFIDAMDNWDEAAADVAMAGLVRSHGAHEIFELLCRYGVRDFREIGHKQIYIANSFRALEVIGWRHAEPVLRSLAFAILDRTGEKLNPSRADLPPDRPYRRNLENAKKIRSLWLEGTASADATLDFIHVVRSGSSVDTSDKVVELLNRGVHPQSIFDACFDSAGELLMRAPGILSLHATTFTNAVHYSWQHAADDETRRILLLQNAAFLPLFRGQSTDKGIHIDTMEAAEMKAGQTIGVDEIFDDISSDKLRAAQKILAYLKENPTPEPLVHAARRLIFLKGRDAHDYKYSSAVLEDYHAMTAPWRDRYLAASAFFLRGSGDSDNNLVQRIRSALAA